MLRLRVPRGTGVDRIALRYTDDGEARFAVAERDGEDGADEWWTARFAVQNPVVSYRWLLGGGDVGYAWVNGLGVVTHDVPDADDFVLSVRRPAPDWHLESVVYEIFPDRFARGGVDAAAPAWAIERAWDEPVEAGPRHGLARVVRRRPARDRAAARPRRGARRERGLPHADLPGREHAPLRRPRARPRRPAARRRRGARRAGARGARARHARRRRPDHEPRRHRPRLVPRGAGGRGRRRARLLPVRRRDPARLRGVVGDPDAAEAQLALARAARADARDRPLAGSTAGSTAGGSTSRT